MQKMAMGSVEIDFATYNASRSGKSLQMTPKEFEILKFLWQHRNKAVSRDQLLTNVWQNVRTKVEPVVNRPSSNVAWLATLDVGGGRSPAQTNALASEEPAPRRRVADTPAAPHERLARNLKPEPKEESPFTQLIPSVGAIKIFFGILVLILIFFRVRD